MPKAKTVSEKKQLTVGDLTKRISSLKLNQIIYIALLIAVFVIGYLFSRVQTLEKGGSNGNGTVNIQPTPAAQAPAKALTADDIKALAKEVGLNQQEFNSCFDASEYQANVDQDSGDGATAGTSGTPTFYINGVQLVGALPFDSFKTEIEAAIAGTQTGAKVEVATGHFPLLGDENASVTVIEFSDLECPYCRSFFTSTFPQLKKEYIDTGKIKYYFRHFPLDFHPSAKPFANAVECANAQGKFWELHDKIFEAQG